MEACAVARKIGQGGKTVQLLNRVSGGLVLAAAMCVSTAQPQSLQGSTRVDFPVTGRSGQEQIYGYLFLPSSLTPGSRIPAVVLVHGSGGVREGREGFWGREFASSGIAALAIDSFAPRGVGSTVEDQSKVSNAQMARDAFGAFAYLSKHGSIDAARVAVMGMSKGGAVAMQTADEREWKAAGAPFAAHIPLYPGCSLQYRNPKMRAPMLVLIGAEDDYTGVKSCAEYVSRISAGGGQVELKTYEGAHHGFDAEIDSRRSVWLRNAQNYRDCVVLLEDNGGATLANTGESIDISNLRQAIDVLTRTCMRRGATVGFYPDIRQRALEDVKAFLKTHLMK